MQRTAQNLTRGAFVVVAETQCLQTLVRLGVFPEGSVRLVGSVDQGGLQLTILIHDVPIQRACSFLSEMPGYLFYRPESKERS